MTKQELVELVETGREIEFKFNDKMFSITYSNEDKDDYISFCEFYKETTDVSNVDELCEVQRYGVKVIDMLESIQNKDIYIF